MPENLAVLVSKSRNCARRMLERAVEQSPSAGPLGTRSTAMTATCGCGWSGETPRAGHPRAMTPFGLVGQGSAPGAGGPARRLGWRNPAGCGAARATASKGPRVYDWAAGGDPAPEGAGHRGTGCWSGQRGQARGTGLATCATARREPP